MIQTPFWVLVPAGYETYLHTGQPTVVRFNANTEVKVDGIVNSKWYSASQVRGTPAGIPVLIISDDVGTKLRISQLREMSARDVLFHFSDILAGKEEEAGPEIQIVERKSDEK